MHHTSSPVVHAACKALCVLGLHHLFAAVASHPTLRELQSAACGVLADLEMGDDNNAAIVSGTVVDHTAILQLVYTAMRSHLESAGVQVSASVFLDTLAKTKKGTAIRIVSSGGLEHLCAAMSAHQGSEEVQGATCWVLFRLAARVTNVAKVARAGLSHVYTAMSAHADSERVHESAWKFLAFVTEKGGERVKRTVVGGGALRRLHASMSAHLKCPNVQAAVCWTLESLCHLDIGILGDLVTSGCLDHMFAAMSANIQAADVLESACWTLAMMTRDGLFVGEVISRGGLGRLRDVMTANLSSAPVQENACLAIGLLAAHSDAVRRTAILASRVLACLCDVMRAYQTSAEVQLEATSALFSLAQFSDTGAEVVSCGGLDRLYAAMAAHPSNVDLQEAACRALFSLPNHRVNIRPMRASGADEPVRFALANFPIRWNILVHGRGLLARLIPGAEGDDDVHV